MSLYQNDVFNETAMEALIEPEWTDEDREAMYDYVMQDFFTANTRPKLNHQHITVEDLINNPLS